ncbi:hypothetical protein ACWFRM_00955 [Streptomyces sp. NPDC055144]
MIGAKGLCTYGWARIPADEYQHEFLVRRSIDDSEPPVQSLKGTYACRPSGGIRVVIRMITTDDGARVPAQHQVSWSAAGIDAPRRHREVRAAGSRQGLAGRRSTRAVPQ